MKLSRVRREIFFNPRPRLLFRTTIFAHIIAPTPVERDGLFTHNCRTWRIHTHCLSSIASADGEPHLGGRRGSFFKRAVINNSIHFSSPHISQSNPRGLPFLPGLYSAKALHELPSLVTSLVHEWTNWVEYAVVAAQANPNPHGANLRRIRIAKNKIYGSLSHKKQLLMNL